MRWTDYSDSFARAAAYVQGRQCRNGGFCFYRNEYLEEPNLSDTWHALAALKLLQVTTPRSDDVEAWLAGFDPTTLHPEALHDWAFSRQLIRPAWAPAPQLTRQIATLPLLPPDQPDNFSGSLGQLLRIAQLKAAFAIVEDVPVIIAWLNDHHHGGYGAKPNLQDTALALELLAAFGAADKTAETRAFIDSLQSPSLGFNNTLDSRYCRIDILLAGVCCCIQLDLPVRYGDVIASTVFAAQRADGAFADVPGSLPTLESHYAALVLLDMLKRA